MRMTSINDTAAKLRILSDGKPFYVIKLRDTEYIETLLSGQATVMHTDWLHDSWWMTESEARAEIAESVRHIYTVHKISVSEEKIQW